MNRKTVVVLLALLAAAFARTDVAAAPIALTRTGTFETFLVEANPIVFKGKLWLLEYIRWFGKDLHHPDAKDGHSHLRFRDMADMKTLTEPFGQDLYMGCAYAEGDRVYVTACRKRGAGEFVIISSDDLVHWTEPTTVVSGKDWRGFNSSLCKAGDRYVMGFELGSPAELVGQQFTMFFAESKDLKSWKWVEGACLGKDRYTGAPMLRWHDGWFYFFHLETGGAGYETRVSRSRDLKDWELSPKIVLAADPADRKIHPKAHLSAEDLAKVAAAEDCNASDLDMCEFGGKLRCFYSWGNQRGQEFAALAEADCTEKAFCESFFEPKAEAAVKPAPARPRVPVKPKDYYGRIAQRLGAMLPRTHVLQHKLDDEISQRAWTNLVTYYDYDHSVFLQSDLDRLAAHEKTIDDELKEGDVAFGFDLHNLYVERLQERMVFASNLLARADWDFATNETYRVKRKDAPWPATRAEAEDLWRKRLKNEVLVQIVNKELDAEERAAKSNKVAKLQAPSSKLQAPSSQLPVPTNAAPEKVDTPEEVLIKRYRQYAQTLTEPDEEAVLQHYLSAVARAYDPHSDYMSPEVKEDFDMEMNLALYGVGAVLSVEDGAVKIVEIMRGGPMDRDGRIKEGDKIVGVRQADGPIEDIMWQPLKKVVKRIRGPKGTRVTLQIVPKADPSGKKLIELVRDEIKLEDQAATGRVERVELDGITNKLGYVHLPGFYGTMDKKMSDPAFRSCAMDVAKFLANFNAEGAEGLVLDLRGNGGGSLREAVMLSALFVPEGPVVQIRDVRSTGCLPIPRGNPVAFRKPMVVLTDRASASASEIVAGHLQDVGRALVLGDGHTHGKGTVQSVMGMGPDKYGSCKITTARFYRISGRSTQVEGVAADIRLPSLLDSLDIGEDKLTYALPFSRILPAEYEPCWNMREYLGEVSARSAARLRDDRRYQRHVAHVAGMKGLSERTDVPLERAARKAQMAADRDLRDVNDDDGEDNDEDREEKVISSRRGRSESKDDIVLQEALRVLADLVRLNKGAEVPVQEGGWWL